MDLACVWAHQPLGAAGRCVFLEAAHQEAHARAHQRAARLSCDPAQWRQRPVQQQGAWPPVARD
eukprot:6717389-Lingulodinium_polyedra.AAC.1